MEPSRKFRTSVSQGSLHSRYKTPGPPDHAYSRSQRQPLRSVSGNLGFLQSPGPLESMLKTTTETGDIGFFSIQPFPSVAHHKQLSRHRLYSGDTVPLSRSRARAYHNDELQDDRKWLPSYRDTTSEIISLYGSDARVSPFRPSSPQLNDSSRSYSMTTCSSRHVPSQRSFATLQSRPSTGTLQRPRSRFPYPTRLKRPGARPASPAFTNSRAVDYGRKTELDCGSHGTFRGSYKPSNSQGIRRPPPLSLRHEANRSTTSLPCRGLSRGQSPSPSIPWTPGQARSAPRDSSDQSMRSASLTSIVEMYRRPEPKLHGHVLLPAPGSFYYDYSEAFGNEAGPPPKMDDPLCPIPQRAGRMGRALILGEDTQVCTKMKGSLPCNDALQDLDDTTTRYKPRAENASEFVEPTSDTADQESQHSLDVHCDDTDGSSTLLNPLSDHYDPKALSVCKPSMLSKSVGLEQATVVPTLSKGMSAGGLSPSTSLSGPKYLDSLRSEHDSERATLANELRQRRKSESLELRSSPTPSIVAEPVLQVQAHEYERKHRRKNAAMRISTMPTAMNGNGAQEVMGEFGIASSHPQDSGTVHHLIEAQAVPQCMKSLPPLPHGSNEHLLHTTDVTVLEGAQQAEANHTQRENGQRQIDGTSQPIAICTSSSILEEYEAKQAAQTPRLRVRSSMTGLGRKYDQKETVLATDTNHESRPRKLKLKISRSQIRGVRCLPKQAVNSSDFSQCHLHEINSETQLSPGEPSYDSINHSNATDEVNHNSSSSADGPLKPENLTKELGQLESSFSLSPNNAGTLQLTKLSKRQLLMKHASNPELRAGSVAPRRLRQKISLLRLRMPGSQDTAASKGSSKVRKTKRLPTPLHFAGVSPLQRPGVGPRSRVDLASSDGKSGRVKRWANGAKRAVRSCVRRTLDRQSRRAVP